MTEPTTDDRPALQLSGRDGNVFAIFGAARRAAEAAGWPADRYGEYLADAMRGDYDHALRVTMTHFDVS